MYPPHICKKHYFILAFLAKERNQQYCLSPEYGRAYVGLHGTLASFSYNPSLFPLFFFLFSLLSCCFHFPFLFPSHFVFALPAGFLLFPPLFSLPSLPSFSLFVTCVPPAPPEYWSYWPWTRLRTRRCGVLFPGPLFQCFGVMWSVVPTTTDLSGGAALISGVVSQWNLTLLPLEAVID